MKLLRLWLTLLMLLVVASALFSGCGEKIAIPEPEGIFGIASYRPLNVPFHVDDPKQIAIIDGALFVIHGDSLSRRYQNFNLTSDVNHQAGMSDLTALCADEDLGLVFVYDENLSTVMWYNTDLDLLGSDDVPDVQSGVSMTTSPSGIEIVGATTFLYIADPDSGVVHRLAFDEDAGTLSPFGILANDEGESARFVLQAAGLATDIEDSVLVCDTSAERHWVIRFISEPDMEDVTPNNPDDHDLMRGKAALFRSLNCVPLPAAAYVLGDAPGCNDDDWEGGPSDLEGAFDNPQAVAVDGSGRVFVSDSNNDRVQIFEDGVWVLTFNTNHDDYSSPTSLVTVDKSHPTVINYGAYVFVVFREDNLVQKYISYEEELSDPGILPPPQ